MRLCSIASGSSGNCIYTGSDNTHIIIDAGLSGKKIEQALNELELTGKDLSALLITHEHSDHIQGLGVLARRYGMPIYATEGTIDAILQKSNLGKLPQDIFHIIKADEDFALGDLMIHPVKVSHDAAEPVAYRVSHDGKSIAVMTDLGYFDDYIVDNISGLDALLLESNHDIRMLEVGRYPYYLKQRILGKEGHLSNEAAGRLLGRVLHDNIKKIMLGHLSQENNMAELAYETVRLEVEMGDNDYKVSDFDMIVASRYARSEAVSL